MLAIIYQAIVSIWLYFIVMKINKIMINIIKLLFSMIYYQAKMKTKIFIIILQVLFKLLTMNIIIKLSHSLEIYFFIIVCPLNL